MSEWDVDMVPVASSNLASAGYDEEASELYVSFRSGSTYVYSGVGREVLNELLASPSPGSFFARHIKGRYQYRQE